MYPKHGFAESVKHFEEKETIRATSLCKHGETCSADLYGQDSFTALEAIRHLGRPFSPCTVSCSPLSPMQKTSSALQGCLSLKPSASVIFLSAVNKHGGQRAQRWHTSDTIASALEKLGFLFSLCVLVLLKLDFLRCRVINMSPLLEKGTLVSLQT